MNEGKKLISLAKEFSHWAHDSIGQRRKYPPADPYWVHTDRVAELVERFHGKPSMVAAAHLHDVLEDVEPVLIKQVRSSDLRYFQTTFFNFPVDVRDMTRELTHVYTAEAFPRFSRAIRKILEAQRLATFSRQTRLIKVCDMIDNTVSIVEHDPDFAKVYLREKEALIELIKRGLPKDLIDCALSQLSGTS